MSPLFLASILGVHFNRRGSDQPCSLWWLEIVGNWVSPSSSCALVSDSLSMVSSRYSTGSRLPGWPVGNPYYREKNRASHTHGQAVVFYTELSLLPSGPLPEQAAGIAVFTQGPCLFTHPGCPRILLARLTRWLDSALGCLPPSFRTGTPQMMLTLYRRIWLKEKGQISSF